MAEITGESGCVNCGDSVQQGDAGYRDLGQYVNLAIFDGKKIYSVTVADGRQFHFLANECYDTVADALKGN